MSREISNAGYGLSDNGIIVADSAQDSIRVRANLDNDDNLGGIDEDVRFVLQTANREIVRYDNSTATSQRSVLATNITKLVIKYFDIAGNEVGYGAAERVSIEVEVFLPASAEEPEGVVNLVSQVTLRNAPITLGQF
jgi:hypothetical protein